MWTVKFWKRSTERAIKASAATSVGLMSGDGMGLLDVDWVGVGSVTGLAFVVSILMSVSSAPIGPDKESPDITG